MNSDEVFSENVIVNADDLAGFQAESQIDTPRNVKLDAEEDTESKNIPSQEHHTSSMNQIDIDDNQEFYDVIIVGAGISGLSSAYFLKKKHPNLKMLIIEAKDRVNDISFTF